MQMTFLKKIVLGAMAVAVCAALSPAYAEDEEEKKPAAEGEAVEGLPDLAAKPEKFFFPLVRCRLIDGCNVMVKKSSEAAWTEAVTVKCSSKKVTITEQNCSRTIPAFHHSCPVVIEIFFKDRHIVVVLPRFRNTHHNCKRKRNSIH